MASQLNKMADDLEKRHKWIEKRAFPRVKKELTVQYSVKELPQAEGMQPVHKFSSDISRTKELSEEGMLFTACDSFPLQTILTIKLQVPVEAEEKAFELEACVVGCEHLKGKTIYGIRVKFINLKPEQQKALRNFVQLLSKS